MSNFFSTPQPIEFDITIERNAIVETVVSTLNKMAEARFAGQNTQYVNNMQPEVDLNRTGNLFTATMRTALPTSPSGLNRMWRAAMKSQRKRRNRNPGMCST